MKNCSNNFEKIVFTLIVVLFVGLMSGGGFNAYADGESFSNHPLSADGGVVANYNSVTKELTISGAGTVEYDRWVAMAQKIDSRYFSYLHVWKAWGLVHDENDMSIIFNGQPKAIKLCGSGGQSQDIGLFMDFSGTVFFNGAVDIAPFETSLSYMFFHATAFNQPLDFDTSNVTNMNHMFSRATAFNQTIDFDTSNVKSMRYMFSSAESFNQPLDFDTSNVTDMAGMFRDATVFNQPLDFDTSKVTKMEHMFRSAAAFNHPLNFDTSKVTNMSYMFYNASAFNSPVNFNTLNVTNMEQMFSSTFGIAYAFNQPLDFDTSKVTNMKYMFSCATAFNQPLDFDTSSVEYMSYMLYDATSFKQPISFNISSLKNAQSMFENSAVERVVLNYGTHNQNASAQKVFKGCPSLKYLEFGGLKNAEIFGFSGDYLVEENGAAPIAKSADEGYDFTDNQSYKVYLQPEAPLGVPTVSLSKAGSAIKVSWTAVTGATGYQVYRADKNGGPFTKFKTTSGLVYTNAGNLVPGMPYYYKVRAYKNDGGDYIFGAFSEVKGYYAPGALAAPDKPSLSLDKNGNGIRLNWNAQKRITGYQVFKSLSPDKPFSYLKTASGNATKYTNLSGLTQGRPYYYKIRAYRMAKGVRKYGAFSNVKGMFAGTNQHALGAVSFSLEDNPNVSAPNVRVRWQGVSGADGYCVYRWNSAAQNWTGLKKTGPNARVYTNINGVVNHKTNFYGMRPYHISGGTTYYGNIGQAKGYRVDK